MYKWWQCQGNQCQRKPHQRKQDRGPFYSFFMPKSLFLTCIHALPRGRWCFVFRPCVYRSFISHIDSFLTNFLQLSHCPLTPTMCTSHKRYTRHNKLNVCFIQRQQAGCRLFQSAHWFCFSASECCGVSTSSSADLMRESLLFAAKTDDFEWSPFQEVFQCRLLLQE